MNVGFVIAASLLALGGVGAAVVVATADDGCGGTLRTYYVAAEPVMWDYAPSGYDQVTGGPFDQQALTFMAPGDGRIGRAYHKAMYMAYTDGTFTTPVERRASEAHMGILGPAIRGEVGDTIRVVFLNRATFPASMHAHGVDYADVDEGAWYAGRPAGVMPGEQATYTWTVPESAGPSAGGSRAWLYHSHVMEMEEVNAGLVGPLVIAGCGQADTEARPTDVDREVFAYYSVMNENHSPLLEQNIKAFLRPSDEDGLDRRDAGFMESNRMHAINGYMYGNMPEPVFREGDRVRWYLLSLGSEMDLHTAHWHGNKVDAGTSTDVVELLPASMRTVDMKAGVPGRWLFHCHVDDHMMSGMVALYQIRPQ